MNITKKLLPVSLILGSLLTGCGSETSAPEAIVFNQSNASGIAVSAAIYAEASPSFVSAVETSLPPSQAAIDLVTKLAFDKDRHDLNIAVGVVPGEPCTDGGSTSFSGEAGSNSRTGTVSFNNCNEGGFVIDGSFSVSSTWVSLPGSYTNTGVGSITMSFGGQSFTLSLDYDGSGDSSTGDFANDISFSISIPSYGSFSVATTSTLVGNIYSGGILSGVLVVTGGQGTRIRVTFNANGTADVDLDNGNGVFVFHSII